MVAKVDNGESPTITHCSYLISSSSSAFFLFLGGGEDGGRGKSMVSLALYEQDEIDPE